MLRLRKVLVLVWICCTKGCKIRPSDTKPTHFEGELCPVCEHAFTPSKMRVIALDRLIRVDFRPPPYFRELWCRCTVCGNFYEIDKPNWIAHCCCKKCGKAFWTQEELQAIVKGCATDLEQAREIDKARHLLDKCPHCLADLPPAPWCPLCAHEKNPPANNCLPPSETVVWKRNFQYHESLEELRAKNQEAEASAAQSQQAQVWPVSAAPMPMDILDKPDKKTTNGSNNHNPH